MLVLNFWLSVAFRDVPLLRPYPPVTCAAEFGFRQNSWIRMGRLSQMWHHSVDWSIQTYPNESKSRCKGWGDRGDHKKSKTDSIESLISNNRRTPDPSHYASSEAKEQLEQTSESNSHREARGTMWHHVAMPAMANKYQPCIVRAFFQQAGDECTICFITVHSSQKEFLHFSKHNEAILMRDALHPPRRGQSILLAWHGCKKTIKNNFCLHARI